MIRALIVEDSEVMQTLMVRAVEEDGDISVVGIASDGRGAVRLSADLKPDVITMDIQMPEMNGLDATRKIMAHDPRPIVMVAAVDDLEDQRISFESMEAGAVWLVRKPKGQVTADWKGWASNLRNVIRSMAEVRVVHAGSRDKKVPARPRVDRETKRQIELIVIAASTGGPTVLRRVLEDLPADYPVPILICQHIAEGFVQGLAEWLGTVVKLPVRVAAPNMRIAPGVILAPDNGHLEVIAEHWIRVTLDDGSGHYVPSADRLLSSAAEVFGGRALGIIMTGMGCDGAHGMRELFHAGAMTIGQEKRSSLIYSMPRVAKESGWIKQEMTPDQMAFLLGSIPGASKNENGPMSVEIGK